MALPLLPANQIEEAYNDIVSSMNLSTRLILNRFLSYYERKWLRQVTPEVFSVYNIRRRTNNNLESYHKTLIDRFGLHSNIWTFSGKNNVLFLILNFNRKLIFNFF